MKKQVKIGLVILAAGASTRMKKPKQLLEFNGKSLLENAVQAAVNSVCRPIAVVLGANADILNIETKNFGALIAENLDWKNGMSSSIKVGLEKILENDDQINGVLIMVCDQPFVSAELLDRIVETYQMTDSPIVASEYAETRGVPALFDRQFFPQLFDSENSGGAKKIIERFQNQTTAVYFPEGAFDIDTPEDYLKLTGIQKHT